MSWAKIDDRLHSHTKVRKAGLEAMGLWVLCLSHCAAQLTDGFVDMVDIETTGGANGLALAERLVTAGLWQHVEGGFQFRDYLEHNPSAEEVKAQREKYKQRHAKRKPGEKAVSVASTRDAHGAAHVAAHGATRVLLTEQPHEQPHELLTSPDPDPDPDPVSNGTHTSPARVHEREASGATLEIVTALRSHPELTAVATVVLAEQIEGRRMGKGTPIPWIVAAIGDVARDAGAESATGSPLAAAPLAKMVVRYCDRARAPQDVNAAPAKGQGATISSPTKPPYHRAFQFEPRPSVPSLPPDGFLDALGMKTKGGTT